MEPGSNAIFSPLKGWLLALTSLLASAFLSCSFYNVTRFTFSKLGLGFSKKTFESRAYYEALQYLELTGKIPELQAIPNKIGLSTYSPIESILSRMTWPAIRTPIETTLLLSLTNAISMHSTNDAKKISSSLDATPSFQQFLFLTNLTSHWKAINEDSSLLEISHQKLDALEHRKPIEESTLDEYRERYKQIQLSLSKLITVPRTETNDSYSFYHAGLLEGLPRLTGIPDDISLDLLRTTLSKISGAVNIPPHTVDPKGYFLEKIAELRRESQSFIAILNDMNIDLETANSDPSKMRIELQENEQILIEKLHILTEASFAFDFSTL